MPEGVVYEKSVRYSYASFPIHCGSFFLIASVAPCSQRPSGGSHGCRRQGKSAAGARCNSRCMRPGSMPGRSLYHDSFSGPLQCARRRPAVPRTRQPPAVSGPPWRSPRACPFPRARRRSSGTLPTACARAWEKRPSPLPSGMRGRLSCGS